MGNKNETCNTVLEVTNYSGALAMHVTDMFVVRDTRNNVEVAPKNAEDFRFVQLEVKRDNAARDVRTGDGTHAPLQEPFNIQRHHDNNNITFMAGKGTLFDQSFLSPTPLTSAFHLLPLSGMITPLRN